MSRGDLPQRILTRVRTGQPSQVWTASDFASLGTRRAVDVALHRLVVAGHLRRLDRGLYDRPSVNPLTERPTAPDYRQVLEAIARRDGIRLLVDGLTAANDLGLTNAVPGRVVVHTDARRRSLTLGNLTISFQRTAPSRLYWAGRPAMRVVQALHWLKDRLPTDADLIHARLRAILADPQHGPAIRRDLRSGFTALPGWTQDFLRPLLADERSIAPKTTGARRRAHAS